MPEDAPNGAERLGRITWFIGPMGIDYGHYTFQPGVPDAGRAIVERAIVQALADACKEAAE